MSEGDRLSRIDTLWSVIRRAHGQDMDACRSAQQQLLDHYGLAIRRYLGAALRAETAVDAVFQEFGLAFVRGDYQSAHPERGKLRSFLKTVLFRLVADYRRTLYRREAPAAEVAEEIQAVEGDPFVEEEQFTTAWRDTLLELAWKRMESTEKETQKTLFTVLRYRVDHPELSSSELASRLTDKLGRPISPANARVLTHRAREKFTKHLIDEVLPSLTEPTLECLEEELIELDLIVYCRDALQQMRQKE